MDKDTVTDLHLIEMISEILTKLNASLSVLELRVERLEESLSSLNSDSDKHGAFPD